MGPGPQVSVILPVRNGGKFLPAAVGSILQQSLRDFELLVIDDHSSDASVSGLDRSDRRLKVFSNPGRGVSGAFNYGLSLARGGYIARMDADDLALPERLATQARFMVDNPGIDIAGAKIDFISEQALGEGNLLYRDWLNSLCSPDRIRRELFIECPIPNPSTMFRREAIAALEGYRDPAWPEDYDLFLRANERNMRMGKPENTLLLWRDHATRLTRTSSRYSRKNFQRAKAYYLARGVIPADRPLLLWGSGRGGTLMHDLLAEQGVAVEGFIDVHPRRMGRHKRGKPVRDPAWLAGSPRHFVIVAVGSRGARSEIREFLNQAGYEEERDFLFTL